MAVFMTLAELGEYCILLGCFGKVGYFPSLIVILCFCYIILMLVGHHQRFRHLAPKAQRPVLAEPQTLEADLFLKKLG